MDQKPTAPPSPAAAVPRTPGKGPVTIQTGYHLKPWKIVLLALAGSSVIAGVFIGSRPPADSGGASGGKTGVMVSNFDGSTGQPSSAPPAESGGLDWGTMLKKGGISFFIAFCLGFAFRTFLKLALIFIGVWAASLFLLSEVGWLQVHWDLIDSHFRSIGTRLGDQLTSFQHFVAGSLPSASSAGLGLFVGFKKG